MRLRLKLSPIPAPRPRVTSKGWTYYPKKYKEWREAAACLIPDLLCSAGLVDPLEGPLKLSVEFAATRPKSTKLPFPKGDIDNFLKTLDCFNGLAWGDDYQLVCIEAIKRWAEPGEPGFIDLAVERLGEWV